MSRTGEARDSMLYLTSTIITGLSVLFTLNREKASGKKFELKSWVLFKWSRHIDVISNARFFTVP